MTDFAKIDSIFEQQRKKRWEIKTWDASHRKTLLRLLLDAIIANESEILRALKADFNKPEFETLSTEFAPVVFEARATIGHIKSWAKPRRVSGGRLLVGTQCEVHREARGTVLLISPWNYPFYLTMIPLISAIAAGNSVILKPSELTPATNAIIDKIISSVFEPDFITVVQGDARVAEHLLKLPFDHIFFTGSPRVGKIVMRAAAEHLSSITLELGGKSPTIVDSSCDLQLAAQKIIWGKFVNSGQICIAPDYVFVDAKIADQFCDALKKEIENQLNNRINASIITSQHCQRLKDLLKDCGGEILTPSSSDSADSRRMDPTLVLSPRLDSRLMKEEIFGPILPILIYQELPEVIKYIQEHPKPLALYLFSIDPTMISRVLMETSSGAAVVNDVLLHGGAHNLPFGGVGESGMGNYHGEFGFRTFSHEKAVLKQGPLGRFFTKFYPPYSEAKANLFKLLAGL